MGVQQHHGQNESVQTPQQTWQRAGKESLGLGARKETTVENTFPAHRASRDASSLSVTNDSTLMIAYHSTVKAPARLQTKKAVAVAPGLFVRIHHVFSREHRADNGSDPVQACKSLLHTHAHTHTCERTDSQRNISLKETATSDEGESIYLFSSSPCLSPLSL